MRATMEGTKIIRLEADVNEFVSDARTLIQAADRHGCSVVIRNPDGSTRALIHPTMLSIKAHAPRDSR
jgi:hypothetical protein